MDGEVNKGYRDVSFCPIMLNMTVLLSIAAAAFVAAASQRWGVDSRVDDGRKNL